MKKLGIILTLLLLIGLLAMLLATPASAATYSGTCGGEGDGSNLTWTLDTETGKLLIQGTGAMEDTSWINQPSSPFYSQRQYIKEVIVEEGVTSIGDWSFRNCENLISVMLPNSLIRVGWCAFLGCENLECIRIPESVTDINPRAFAGCSSLSEISLPLSIQRIGKEAFYGTAYAKNEENWYEGCLYCDGWLLEADKNQPLVSVLEGTVGISEEAWSGSEKLVQLSIPDSVQIIGGMACYSCDRLTNLHIGKGVTCIGVSAFGDCHCSIVDIEDLSAWCKISFMTSGPATFYHQVDTQDWSSSFGQTNPLFYAPAPYIQGVLTTDLVIPEDVATISDRAFLGASITSVIISGSTKEIGSQAFANCTGLCSLTIENGVTKIGSNAFGGNYSLSELIIPNSVIHIGSYAFEDCRALTTLTLGNCVSQIGEGAFQGCSNLKYVQIPDSVTSFGKAVFNWCSNLKCVLIGQGLTSIEESTFSNTSLEKVRIPENITRIELGAFSGCNALNSIEIVNAECDIELEKNVLGSANYTVIYGADESTAKSYANLFGYAFSIFVPDNSPFFWHNCTKTETKPTCTEDGGVIYTCSRCGYQFVDQVVVALGHNWGEPTYEWAEDYSAVTATRVCKTDASHVETETVQTTSEVTKEATYDEEGEITYTAVFENEAFETQTKAVATPKLVKPVEFTDVPADAYYANPVAWAVANGITNGTGNGRFSPDATCTRGQVVTFLWRAKGCPEPTNTENPFTDVKETDYFYKAVLWAKETGVTSGTSATTFSPGNGCTRAQVVTFLWRAEGKPAPASMTNPFTDVPAGQYYTGAVLWAVGKGVTTGTSATTFSPDKTCTRGQIVTFLYRDLAE